jgi:ATP-dependent DNA ligase
MSLPNLDKLLAKCEALGLQVTPAGKKVGKADAVRVLRQHFLPPGGLPYEEISPMLCFAEWNLKDEERREMETAPGWVVQKKLNGCRIILHAVKGRGWFAHSRTISVKTFRMEELTDSLLISSSIPDFDATLDAEVMVEKPVDTRPYTSGKGEVTKTTLHSTTSVLHLRPENGRKLQVEQDAPLMFHVFDVIKLDGQDLRKKTLAQRLQHLKTFQRVMADRPEGKYFVFPEYVFDNRPAYVAKVIAEGGEGGVYKKLDSTYEDNSSRLRDAWVKVKKRIEFDAFVTGFTRGEKGTAWENMVGALEFSVYTGPDLKTTHVIGFGQNLTLEQRAKVSTYDPATDTVGLRPEMIGKVAEISGQDVSARELRLSHCTIDRWRPKTGPDGKVASSCVVDMADLRNAAEWVG